QCFPRRRIRLVLCLTPGHREPFLYETPRVDCGWLNSDSLIAGHLVMVDHRAFEFFQIERWSVETQFERVSHTAQTRNSIKPGVTLVLMPDHFWSVWRRCGFQNVNIEPTEPGCTPWKAVGHDDSPRAPFAGQDRP